VSPVFAGTTANKCQFRFWYHMYGYSVASLNVYVRNFVGGPLKQVWSQTGQKGDEWLRARIELNVQGPFQVLIEGIRNSGYAGKLLFMYFR
jgi:hypothetical protein